MAWFELSSGQAPDFRLASTGGESVTRGQFRGEKHLVLVFVRDLAAGTAELLDHLAQVGDELSQADGRMLVITPNTGPGSAALPVLLDPGDAVRTRYAALLPEDRQPAAGEAFLVILNRYGEAEFAARDLLDGSDVAREVANRIWGLAYQCSL